MNAKRKRESEATDEVGSMFRYPVVPTFPDLRTQTNSTSEKTRPQKRSRRRPRLRA